MRLQAIVRGRQVRKQAAVTLRCMQALVRVQARVRARRVRLSSEGQAVQKMLDSRRTELEILKEAEEGWCDSQGTLEEIRSKLQMRKEGAIRRERANSYALSQQKRPNSKPSPSMKSLKSIAAVDKNSWGWSWLERWMAAKPWESRLLMENQQQQPCDISGGCCYSKPLEQGSIQVRKNNVSTRVSAKPPPLQTRSYGGGGSGIRPGFSQEFRCGESCSASSSSIGTSTPLSRTTTMVLASERSSESVKNYHRPSYMNATESIRAKQRSSLSAR